MTELVTVPVVIVVVVVVVVAGVVKGGGVLVAFVRVDKFSVAIKVVNGSLVISGRVLVLVSSCWSSSVVSTACEVSGAKVVEMYADDVDDVDVVDVVDVGLSVVNISRESVKLLLLLP